MCDPVVGILSAASSAVGAIGGHQSAQAQADYQNESAIRNYKHALMVREGKWYNQLATYNNQRVDYSKTLTENNLAASRSYASEQERLNEQYKQAAFSNQGMLTQLLQSAGMAQATGQSGQSAQRQQVMQLAAYGRNNAIVAENLASAKNAMRMRNEQVWYQQKSANNQAWNNVSMAPVPDVAPPQPVMAPGPSGLGLAAGLLGAAAQGVGAFNALKAPQGFTGNNWGGSGASNFQPNTTIPGINYGGMPSYRFPSSTGAFNTLNFTSPFI